MDACPARIIRRVIGCVPAGGRACQDAARALGACRAAGVSAVIAQREPSAEELERFAAMNAEEIARLVLWLLVEEALRGRLLPYRSGAEQFDAQPVQSGEELVVVGGDVVPVRDRAG